MEARRLQLGHLGIDRRPVRLPGGVDVGDFCVGTGELEPGLRYLGFLRLGVEPVRMIDAQNAGWNWMPGVRPGPKIGDDARGNCNVGFVGVAGGIGGLDGMCPRRCRRRIDTGRRDGAERVAPAANAIDCPTQFGGRNAAGLRLKCLLRGNQNGSGIRRDGKPRRRVHHDAGIGGGLRISLAGGCDCVLTGGGWRRIKTGGGYGSGRAVPAGDGIH